MRKFIYILVVFLFFISCNDETGISVGNDVGGIKMRLVITSPSSTVYSKTKAEIDQPTHESLIVKFRYWYLRTRNTGIGYLAYLSVVIWHKQHSRYF